MGVVATAACLALAVALYRVTTVSATARMLGFLLLIEAVTLGTAALHPEADIRVTSRERAACDPKPPFSISQILVRYVTFLSTNS